MQKDPWGRGHPLGLRTQGRGFDSRWVRFFFFKKREEWGFGCSYVYVNWSAPEKALLPPVVVTATSTRPAKWVGDTTVSWVTELNATLAAGVPPKATVDAAVNPVPVITVQSDP